MCTSPLTLENGSVIACRKCLQCIDAKIADWVGRCIAESKVAVATHAATLTYGRSRLGDVDHERSNVLTYSDVQNYLKLLRRHGFPVRFFVTGEFGSTKGRAHWHIVLFWQQRVPPLAGIVQGSRKWSADAVSRVGLNVRFMHQRLDDEGRPAFLQDGSPAYWWPHGWSQFTEGTSAANIAYNCKYVQKDLADEDAQAALGRSTRPPLGAAYFRQLADLYVKQQLAPQAVRTDDFAMCMPYRFPEVRRKNGAPRDFMLRDRSLELFLERYVELWRETYPGRHLPNSELVEEFLDRGAFSKASAGELHLPDARPSVSELRSWMSAKTVLYNRELGCWEHEGEAFGRRHHMRWLRDAAGRFRWVEVRGRDEQEES